MLSFKIAYIHFDRSFLENAAKSIIHMRRDEMKLLKFLTAALVFLVLINVDQPKAEASQLMRTGSMGQDVTQLQSVLHHLGYLQSEPTGYYGLLTTGAVEQFQKDFGLKVDGITGSETLNLISDVDMMAHVVHGEARGESYQGQVAVAAVILNRVESNQFPDTIHNVVFQRNAFTAIYDGQFGLQPDRNAYHAVKDAFLGWDPSGGSVFYYNPGIATNNWIFTRTVIKQIDNHLFAI
jgi:N-acetylmuramoyl-L-alanine amidase